MLPHEHREHADGAVSQRVEHVGSMIQGHSLVRKAANALLNALKAVGSRR